WYLLVDVLKFWRFRELPGLVPSIREWISPDPVYGVSLFTAEYYSHIWASVYRVMVAFVTATVLGIAVGVLMGWSRIFYGLAFPILEMLRPIPILAWIPLAILLLPGREAPIIGLTFLAAFFVTILNTLLGVKAIDEVYFRAARSLGFSEMAILFHVIIPGAMPYIFVGLQIAMGACWFSLVASEIVSGQAGLGYKVWETYYYVQFETMVIVMATLGLLGYVSSALVRIIGNRLMRWRARILAGV
ncbi:ABC transporter permease, partial [Pseudorhodoplanes sp.]|uniref:ABC transporter permease n=1 Tax=Pseudorhodoplanes sp. TaxID=1934341 RepID=UPI003D152369